MSRGQDGQGVALCPLPWHWLFGEGPAHTSVRPRFGGPPGGPQSPRGSGRLRNGCRQCPGFRLKPLGAACPLEGLVSASPLQPWRALPRALACRLAWSGFTLASFPPAYTGPSANTQAARGSACPTGDPWAGEGSTAGFQLAPGHWHRPDPTQALPLWWGPGDLLAAPDTSPPAERRRDLRHRVTALSTGTGQVCRWPMPGWHCHRPGWSGRFASWLG